MKTQIWFIASALLVVVITAFAGCSGTAVPAHPAGNSTAADNAPAAIAISGSNTGPAPGNITAPQGTGGPGGMMPGGNSTSPGPGSGGSPPGDMTGSRNATTSPGMQGGFGGSGPGGAPPGGIPGSGTVSGGSSAPFGSTGGPGASSGGPVAGGQPGGSSTGASSYTFSGAYSLNGGTASETSKTFTSNTKDVSAIYVTNGGDLTLTNPAIATTGDTSSNDASSFYGLNAAVLASGGSKITINGGSITTSGSGANGAFPTGTGSTIVLNGVRIKATGGGGHGVMATNGGVLTLTDVDIETSGANSAPLATDRGSGIVTATRGTILASGTDSPGIYSTGLIAVSDATVTATGSEAAVIEGFNSITLVNTTLTGGVAKTGGTMIYQSMSGDAESGTGTFTMSGGSYTATAGPAFFVTNTNAVISLTGVKVTSNSDTLISAAGTSRWGTNGKNGGTVTFTADGETLTGSLSADSISSIAATLKNGSSLTGTISTTALALDATSSWTVTGDSALTTLSDSSGIAGSTITNICGNGHTVTYDAALAGNSALGGKTYTLAGGGTLVPS